MKAFLFFIFFCLASCQPASSEECLVEGEGQCRLLLEDLRQIASREDLIYQEPILKKRFEKMVDIMLQAIQLEEKNGESPLKMRSINTILNDSLQQELQRVYALEGGRECVERAQKEAMLRLDAKVNKIKKPR